MKRIVLIGFLSINSLIAQDSIPFPGIHLSGPFNYGSSSLMRNFAKNNIVNQHNLYIQGQNFYGIQNFNQVLCSYAQKRANKIIGLGYLFRQENFSLDHELTMAFQFNYSEKWGFSPGIILKKRQYQHIDVNSEYALQTMLGLRLKANKYWHYSFFAKINPELSNPTSNTFLNLDLTHIPFQQLLLSFELIFRNDPNRIDSAISALNLKLHKYATYFRYSLQSQEISLGISKRSGRVYWAIVLSYHSPLGTSPSLELNNTWP